MSYLRMNRVGICATKLYGLSFVARKGEIVALSLSSQRILSTAMQTMKFHSNSRSRDVNQLRYNSKYTNVHKFSRSMSTSKDDDLILAQSYDLFARLKNLISFFGNETALKEVKGYVDAKLVQTLGDGILLHIDLQHPLIKKYKFDPVDFFHGAKDAIINIWKSAASQEFFDYANSTIDHSLEAEYLKENCHPHVFNSLLEISRKLKAVNLEKINVLEYTITDIKLARVMPLYVKSYTKASEHTEDDFLKSLFSSDPTALHKTPDNASTNTQTQTDTSKEDTVKIKFEDFKVWEEKYFPVGSVFLTVRVDFQSYERTEFTIQGEEKKANDIVTSSTCYIDGCVSGQRELEWKIKSMSIRTN